MVICWLDVATAAAATNFALACGSKDAGLSRRVDEAFFYDMHLSGERASEVKSRESTAQEKSGMAQIHIWAQAPRLHPNTSSVK